MSLHLPQTTPGVADWNFPLGIGDFRFADLNRVRRLAELDGVFQRQLADADPGLAERYAAARHANADTGNPDTSALLIDVAKHVGAFIARLFRIEENAAALDQKIRDDQVVFTAKKRFLDRHVLADPPTREALAAMDIAELEFRYREIVDDVLPANPHAGDPERELAAVVDWLLAPADTEASVPAPRVDKEHATRAVVGWARALAFHPELAPRRKHFASFFRPEKLDYAELVPRVYPDPDLPILFEGPPEHRRCRDGFDLTDPRMTDREALGQAHYCIICHPRRKDSCSRGFVEKDGSYRINPLGIPLEGCPLDEKISEAHLLKREGHSIAALAMVMVDNPLCAGTGHRICNDCMKGCIYQKQTPVNIPQIETNILTSVLRLPYGFEIYSLLSKWNPLNLRRPYPLPYNGKNVLVVGMGPAGYTLALYLLNLGFGVVGIEGLKVEPLSIRMRGAKRRVPQPIREIGDVAGPLDQRTILGFGGVSEYGITVRWDKSFLDINYLVLMRRKKFRLYDGVRFGGTLTIDDAWSLGFHHIALATGAGRPTLVPMQKNLLRGVRLASDFLMGLQATGIYKKDSLGNLQVQLPAVVIGGGLTAIDTATELLAYYVVQAEKTLDRYERLVSEIGEPTVRARFDAEEAAILDTWLRHGRAIRAERRAADAANREPDFNRLLRHWGGVTIVYRKRLRDAPAYRLNHEEVIQSLEEGVRFAECLAPIECVPGSTGAVEYLRCEVQEEREGKWRGSGRHLDLPARAVLIAAGTHPNATYESEHPGSMQMDESDEFYRGYRLESADGAHRLVPAEPGARGFFTSYAKEGRYISFFGDNHPDYAGNVVKAMASAKHGHQEIARLFADETQELEPERQSDRERDWVLFAEALDDQLTVEVVDAFRLTGNIVEVIVRAPLAARNFRPGQFYRMQNYEAYAERVAGFCLTMEGIALTGAWVDRARGLLSLIVLEMGGSSRLCALLEPREKIVLMGPTGTPTDIPREETVLLAGGGLGNAVLFSIAAALKANGCRVLYFAGYKSGTDLFKRGEIEHACDAVIWSVDRGEPIAARRPHDRSIVGNIVEAISAYGRGELGEPVVPLAEVERIIAIGSDRMMSAIQRAIRGPLAPYFPKQPLAIGSINSPMQCMMKGICAQCLQRHIDPESGKESFVFSCANQDQFLSLVDFQNLSDRLRQNSTAEKLTSLWIDHLFAARMVQQV